ncbi:hypothetical protein FLL83_07550 [Vibrio cholerae]|nr:hypothetical protein FLL83_07550 [Vibrio cholerae]
MKLQRCWRRSFTPIIECIYAHGDELTCHLPATPSRLGIYGKGNQGLGRFLQEPCHEVVFISVITHERLEQLCFGNRD